MSIQEKTTSMHKGKYRYDLLLQRQHATDMDQSVPRNRLAATFFSTSNKFGTDTFWNRNTVCITCALPVHADPSWYTSIPTIQRRCTLGTALFHPRNTGLLREPDHNDNYHKQLPQTTTINNHNHKQLNRKLPSFPFWNNLTTGSTHNDR